MLKIEFSQYKFTSKWSKAATDYLGSDINYNRYNGVGPIGVTEGNLGANSPKP